jgi:hypothetical protein
MEQSLSILEQKTVEFYGDEIIAVRAHDDTVFVPVRPICDLLGVSWSSQQNRINRDEVLSTVAETISVFVTNTQGADQRRAMLCLPLDYISGFLFGLSAGRVREDIRDKIIRYKKECYHVLAEAFQEGRLTPDTDFEALLQTGSPAAQAYQTFQALAKLARHQLILESRLDQHEMRLEQLESTLGDPGRFVTPDQASQISQAVKAVAMKLGQKSGRNEYGAVYGELYRKFGITGYKQLPARRFDEAMKFLTDWHEGLIGTLPF